MDAESLRTAVDYSEISFLFNLPLNGAQEILNSAGENTTLTKLRRSYPHVTDIQEARLIASILRTFKNIKTIDLYSQDLTGDALLPIVDAVRGHRHRLEELRLSANSIGDIGCFALAALLEDPNCNLHTLELQGNDIGNEGAIAIANSLVNNTKLKKLRLNNNRINQSMIQNAFSKVVCNTSSVNDTYNSNHTRKELYLESSAAYHLSETNIGGNTSHIAIRKILRHHPNIDMKPLFELAASVEGEQNLKGLPYVLDWFDRAKETVGYNVEQRKLRVIYQFAQAMPLLFVPTSHINGSGRVYRRSKRKRVGS